ncbi:MAG TPA: VPLPA-CTERM sorting domain-containing protein [Xanthobacteraceae bacterium]|jgi:hypothetical protein
MKTANKVPLLLAIAAIAVPIVADAEAVTYDFTGKVISTLGSYSAVPTGSLVSGSFTIDYANINTGQSSGTFVSSEGFDFVNVSGAPFSTPLNNSFVFSQTVSGTGFSYTTTPGTFDNQSFINGTGTTSNQLFADSDVADNATQHTRTGFTLSNFSTNERPYDTNGLPLFGLSGELQNGFIVSGDNGVDQNQVLYQITSVTPVPLPASAWLLLSSIAIFGVGASPRRRRQAQNSA